MKISNIIKGVVGVTSLVAAAVLTKKAVTKAKEIKKEEDLQVRIIDAASRLPEEKYSKEDEEKDRMNVKIKYTVEKLVNWIKPAIAIIIAGLNITLCVRTFIEYINNSNNLIEEAI